MLPINTRPRIGLAASGNAFAGTVVSECVSMKNYRSIQALIMRGENDAESGSRASLTNGTTNAQLVIEWGTAGEEGNGKTVEIIQAGTLTALSVVVDTDSVVINLATDVMDDEISTVNEVIAALYADKVFRDNWIAHDGVGDGTGVLQPAAEDELAGGADAGSGTIGTTKITVEKCSDSSGSNPEAIDFYYRRVDSADVATDYQRVVAATGVTTDAVENVVYEILVEEHIGGMANGDKPFVRVKMVEQTAGAVNGAITFVGHNSRYGDKGSLL